jgi:hypothetical protein
MEIHKPKPIHNWREFLKEYAIIVIGVLTALAAEQAAEAVHWHYRVQDALEAVRLEVRDDNGPQAYTRAAAMACFDKQLDTIRAAIEADHVREDITTLIARYDPPSRTWDSNAWDSMLASGVASHIPPDEMISWGQMYVGIPLARSLTARERADVIALRPIRQNGDRLSTNEADTMLAAVSRLRADNRSFGEGSGYYVKRMEQNGIVMSQERKSSILADLRSFYRDCVVVPSTAHLDMDDQLDETRRAMAPPR